MPAFAGSALEARVHALLGEPAPGTAIGRDRGVLLGATLLAGAPALLALPLHHVLEHGLELLVALIQ